MSSSVPVIQSKLASIDTFLKSLHGNFLLSISIRGAAALVALAANIALARLLGVAEYGRYMTLYSAAIVLGSLAVRGTDQLLTRELSAGAAVQHYWRRVLARWVTRRVVPGVAIAVMLYVVWSLLAHTSGSGGSHWLADLAALVLIALNSICILVAGGLNGFRASQRSQSLVPLVNNGMVLVLLGVLWFGAGEFINGTAALWFQTIGYGLACVLGWYWLRSASSRKNGQSPIMAKPATENVRPADWALASRHFFFITIAAVLINRVDVVFVSTLAGNHTAGIYVAGARLAQVALLVAVSVNTILSPRISEAWHAKNHTKVRQLVRSGLAFTFTVAVFEVLIAIFFGSDIIRVFGSAYSSSTTVFILIVVAYALWTLAAPGYALLNMTGSEKVVANLSWMVAIVNVIAILVLVPFYGAVGGGWAMFAGYAVVLPVLIGILRKTSRFAAR